MGNTADEHQDGAIEQLRAFSRLVNAHALALENVAKSELSIEATRLALTRSAILARRLAKSASDDAADLESDVGAQRWDLKPLAFDASEFPRPGLATDDASPKVTP